MRRTAEQQEFAKKLRRLVDAAGMPRVRVVPDAEGFPIAPGRLGQVEWLGVEGDGTERLYVFTGRARMIPRLLAIPGVRRWQMGDTEARMWFPANAGACLREVLRLIRARVRRQSIGNAAALEKHRATRAAA